MPKQAKEKSRKEDYKHNSNELQEKYFELQMLKQQVSTYVEQKQALDERESELTTTINALKKLDTVKTGEEIWSSVGSGTFVRSDIKDIQKVLVAVGAGVIIKEDVPKAVKILESRLSEIEMVIREIVAQANAIVERIQRLEPEVQKLAEQS